MLKFLEGQYLTTARFKRIGRVLEIAACAGEIESIIVYAPKLDGIGDYVFNVKVDGVNQFSGGDRITLNSSTKLVIKDELEIEADLGAIVSLELETAAQTGIMPPIYFIVNIEDGASSGGADELSDLSDVQFTSLANDDFFQRKAGKFVNRTIPQVKTDLAINNVDNTSDATKNSAAATLTNKTVSGANNTLSNIPQSAVTNLTTDLTAKANLSGATFTGAVIVPDDAYNASSWNGSTEVPTKNAVRDKIEALSAGGSSAEIIPFISSGTWTKPAGAKVVEVFVIGGGGGGGAGRKGALASNRFGGGGGSGSPIAHYYFNASILGSTETVTVGAGGNGAASQTTNSTNGGNGTDGGNSSFGTWLQSPGGKAGNGGTNSSGGSGGNALQGFPTTLFDTTAGGNGTTNTTSGGGASRVSGGSGGGGSGLNTSNNSAVPGTGGGISSASTQAGLFAVSGGIATSGANGGAGTNAPTNSFIGGTGGGGGGGNNVANGGNGGVGGFPGGGGGGGGASTDSVGNSGAGANGGAGLVIVITYF